MNWRKRKKELDEKYDFFWNNITTNGIELTKINSECDSVEKAIKWRNQTNELPEDLK